MKSDRTTWSMQKLGASEAMKRLITLKEGRGGQAQLQIIEYPS